MKTIIFSLSIICLSLVACGNSDENKEGDKKEVAYSKEDVTEEIAKLKELNSNLLAASPSGAFSSGKALYHYANEFVIKYPHHEKTAAILELSAKGAEAMQQFQEAVNILDKLITEFPESEETPNYMMNKARIIEERMQKMDEAKAAYADLIARFPESQMAKDAKMYVDNFLGKSTEEITQMLDSINVGN